MEIDTLIPWKQTKRKRGNLMIAIQALKCTQQSVIVKRQTVDFPPESKRPVFES